MTEFRAFHNADPPQLLRLWHSAGLGRGAAECLNNDAFEVLIFSQPYFDPNGLIVAEDNGEIVGFVLAGFGTNAESSALDYSKGVICAVIVHPNDRRKGIGRELVRRAEEYLRSKGATEITAGASGLLSPFLVGLYGGTRPSGFLLSDPIAGPFFEAIGYEAKGSIRIYQRDLLGQKPKIKFHLVNIRRKMQLMISDDYQAPNWWWLTRMGRLETLHFELVPKSGDAAVASATVVGLDLYIPKWEERVIGLTDVFVKEEIRSQGYGQSLLLEIARRLQDELITKLEWHVEESNIVARHVAEAVGYHQIDTGIVYQPVSR
ncbi:GNAT family N-acetyltransferase [Gimesia aquarii]|uniref:Putative acetyltransferase n=1 Tax=Gimesia aquarii TaxID=2527964 RepID=A0A517VQL0_9PLAN|nr:GNAT family N-acetyltransferase [Gimesia aquarii]QDT95308.1 putative acetyltransferase [Gimesia aquarii]